MMKLTTKTTMPKTPKEMRIVPTVFILCIVLSRLERLHRIRPVTNNTIARASNEAKLMVIQSYHTHNEETRNYCKTGA